MQNSSFPDPFSCDADGLLARIGWGPERQAELNRLGAHLGHGRVVRVDRGQVLVQAERELTRCTFTYGIGTVTVGDWVAFDGAHPAPAWPIREVLTRTSLLVRSSKDAAQQPIAANVDLVFVVHPSDGLNPRRLERELTQIADSGASPVVLLSKSELAMQPGRLAFEASNVARGIPLLPVSAFTGQGIRDLRACFAGNKTGLFIGPSGAGKSTIANALLGSDIQQVGDVRANDRRGRHTTTARHLLPLPFGGALIDTPGMREFGVTADSDTLDIVFDDIASMAVNCRFRNCSHGGEPGCAVAEALASGGIASDRLDSYRKLEREREAWQARNDPLLRRQRQQIWKSRTRGMRQQKKLGGKWG